MKENRFPTDIGSVISFPRHFPDRQTDRTPSWRVRGCWVCAAPIETPRRDGAVIVSPPSPKVTLDLQNSTEKFGGFLRSALDVLSQILELATLQDIGKVRVSFLLAEPPLPHAGTWAECLGRLVWARHPGRLVWAWHPGWSSSWGGLRAHGFVTAPGPELVGFL